MFNKQSCTFKRTCSLVQVVTYALAMAQRETQYYNINDYTVVVNKTQNTLSVGNTNVFNDLLQTFLAVLLSLVSLYK